MKNYRSSGFLNDEYEKKYAKKIYCCCRIRSPAPAR